MSEFFPHVGMTLETMTSTVALRDKSVWSTGFSRHLKSHQVGGVPKELRPLAA
jgi:hypothetical protein